MAVLVLPATKAPVEQIAEVAAWRLSVARQRLYKREPEVQALYIIDAANALPSPQFEDRLRKMETARKAQVPQPTAAQDQSYEQSVHEILTFSVQRAIMIYCGFYNLDRLHFVDDIEQAPREHIVIEYRKEIAEIMDNQDQIDAQRNFQEKAQSELAKTLNRVVMPEFDRIDAKLTTISQRVEEISEDAKDIKSDTKSIRKEHGEYLRQIAAKLGL